MLVFAHADHQRAAVPGRDDDVGRITEEDRQAVSPLQLRQRAADGRDQRFVPIGGAAAAIVTAMGQFLGQAVGHQVGDHLGIGSRVKLVARA